jgi:hypothetical protein
MSFITSGLGGSVGEFLLLGFESGDPPVVDPAAVWSYVLSNGKTAGQNLVEVNAGIATLLARSCFDELIQGTLTAGDILRILAAVAAGKTTIAALGGGAANVVFRAIDDSRDTVQANMAGSERTTVTLDPTD